MLELVVKVHKEEKLRLRARALGDKAIKSIVKKVGAQQLGVDEVNFTLMTILRFILQKLKHIFQFKITHS